MSLIERMRSADRSALKELLTSHGAALAELHRALGGDLDRAIVRIWKETLVASPGTDERSFVLFVGAKTLVEPSQTPPPQTFQTDFGTYVRQVAKVASGLGSDVDAKMLSEMPAVAPLPETRTKVERAIESARGVDGALPDLDATFSRVESELR